MLTNIRNFCIISHIDAGKSTLADRFLEVTKTIAPEKMRPQYLDGMPLERERGITIKLQPVRMEYNLNLKPYVLNLIDTPGHVDFSYEVSRSLAAIEGVILLVDASRGVQAQTLANLHLARQQNLVIIPVINKIDLGGIDLEARRDELAELLKIPSQEIICASAKKGIGIEAILKRVVEKVPPPKGSEDSPLRALIFDSFFDEYRGVVCYVRVRDGSLIQGERLKFLASQVSSEAKEIGIFIPQLKKREKLSSGEIGYIVTGLKDIKKCRVGDTITKLKIKNQKLKIEALPGYREPQLMVFAGFYLKDASRISQLQVSLEKLKLNDASLNFKPETQAWLGPGYRMGFLGPLHMDITKDRLKREYGLDLIVTPPSVAYRVRLKGGEAKMVHSPLSWPEESQMSQVEEPWLKVNIITPSSYIGPIMNLAKNYKGVYIEARYVSHKTILHYQMPLALLLTDFYDKLKSVSSGYASYNYQFLDWRKGELVRLNILVAGEVIEHLASIVYKERAQSLGRRIVEALKEILPRQLFEVKIQAALGARILASAKIPSLRKDVTAKLYGGDVTRKKKLLAKQKKGKKKLARLSKVDIPPEAYRALSKF